MRIPTTLLAAILVILVCSPAFADEKRLEVLPVLFVPSDNKAVGNGHLREYSDLLSAHLRLAREHWLRILKTDTFQIAREGTRVYYGEKPDSYYSKAHPDTAHVMLKELFERYEDNRNDSHYVYLVIYVRPSGAMRGAALGGGRTMNGMPGSGGGFVHLELSSLLNDSPYPFQSTLVHELGHSFGLAHSDCYGYNIANNGSIMSYNLKHHTKGLPSKPGLGGLNPEEYYAIALNRLAFPNFEFVQAVHNPGKGNLDEKTESCFLGEMSEYIGKVTKERSVGYELFFDGLQVNGPDAKFYTRKEAEENCGQNMTQRPRTRVECRFDGRIFVPATKRPSR